MNNRVPQSCRLRWVRRGQNKGFTKYKIMCNVVALVDLAVLFHITSRPLVLSRNVSDCQTKDHRDSNAAFVIAKRGNDVLGGLAKDSVRLRCGLSDSPLSGKETTQ